MGLNPETCDADAFLNPDNFVTSFDAFESHVRERTAERQYASGLDVSRKCSTIFISARGTWSAETLEGGDLQAYERIGYHAHTASLLRGFLAGPAEIIVYRRGHEPKTIKARG